VREHPGDDRRDDGAPERTTNRETTGAGTRDHCETNPTRTAEGTPTSLSRDGRIHEAEDVETLSGLRLPDQPSTGSEAIQRNGRSRWR
jgi:hypothetical protein